MGLDEEVRSTGNRNSTAPPGRVLPMPAAHKFDDSSMTQMEKIKKGK
jgi:hypothetical protein